MTWKNDVGLKLYLDGSEVVSDSTGKDLDLQLNTNKPNLCFGRDVQGQGHFAKFAIGTFSSFNTYLSPPMMRNVYTFYFRSGECWRLLLGSHQGANERVLEKSKEKFRKRINVAFVVFENFPCSFFLRVFLLFALIASAACFTIHIIILLGPT